MDDPRPSNAGTLSGPGDTILSRSYLHVASSQRPLAYQPQKRNSKPSIETGRFQTRKTRRLTRNLLHIQNGPTIPPRQKPEGGPAARETTYGRKASRNFSQQKKVGHGEKRGLPETHIRPKLRLLAQEAHSNGGRVLCCATTSDPKLGFAHF